MEIIKEKCSVTDLKKFLEENKSTIHELLNHMWRTIERIAIKFEDVLPDVDLENSHGNYIRIADGWEEGAYANPSIIFPYGEFGYSLDSLFCTFSLNPKTLDEELLAKLLEAINKNEGITLELYGGDDCFQTFFHSKEEADFDEILQKIKSSKEDVIQIEISVEALPEEELREALIDITKAFYNLFKEKECLVKLPNYEQI
ncbi:MAG: DUF3201 domain-containing protein [Candidatus Heimdallarchaeota archaeon]|nr:DUF3201 domain-containing protein [Candidatus Heimdallarchaeota archaeon]